MSTLSPARELQPKRRQNRCCDQCRQSRKACDAGLTSRSAFAKGGRCSTCLRKGKRCTFNWLRQHTAAKQLSQPGSERYRPWFQRRQPSNCVAPLLCQPSWTRTGQGHSDTGLGLTGFQQNLLAPTKTLPTTFETADISWNGHSSSLSTKNSEATRHYPACHPQLGRPRAHHSAIEQIASSSNLEKSCMIAFNSISAPTTTLTSNIGFTSSQHLLSTETIRLSLTRAFWKTYRTNVEQRLSWRGTVANVPYNAIFGSVNDARKFSSADLERSWYRSAVQMDEMAEKLGLAGDQSPTASQKRLTAQALQKVILAFAGQWTNLGQVKRQCRKRLKASMFADDSHEDLYVSDTVQYRVEDATSHMPLDASKQKALFHEAKTAVILASGIKSFRMFLAEVIMATIKSPFNDLDDPNFQSGQCSRISDASVKGSKAFLKGFSVSGRPEYGARSLEHLSWWNCRLGAVTSQADWDSARQPQLWMEFQRNFNVLLWITMTCDSFRSAVGNVPLAIKGLETSLSCPPPRRKNIASNSVEGLINAPQYIGDVEGNLASNTRLNNIRFQWENYLFEQVHLAASTDTFSWPLADADMSRMLRQSLHPRLLLSRSVSRLQHCLKAQPRPGYVEHIIQDALAVYGMWQDTYGRIGHAMLDNYTLVPPVSQDMHAISFGRWYFLCILLAEVIAKVDLHGLGDAQRRLERLAAGTTQSIVLENATCLAKLARGCRQLDELYHIAGCSESGLDPLLNDLWGDCLSTAFSKAAGILMDAFCASRHGWLPFSHDGGHLDSEQLMQDAQDCIRILHVLSSYSKPNGVGVEELHRRVCALVQSRS